jgi:hypothetical protein
MSLSRLLAEAQVLAGGEHQCAVLGHDWTSEGGPQCPRATEDHQPNCSQAVYVCACGAVDYGEPGGPGYRDCITEGPCRPECEPG